MVFNKFNYIYEGSVVYYCGEHCYGKIIKVEKPSSVWLEFKDENNKNTIQKVSMGLLFENELDWNNYLTNIVK